MNTLGRTWNAQGGICSKEIVADRSGGYRRPLLYKSWVLHVGILRDYEGPVLLGHG